MNDLFFTLMCLVSFICFLAFYQKLNYFLNHIDYLIHLFDKEVDK